MLEGWKGDAEPLPRADDQHLTVLAQVAGEKDDDADLRELGRLEGKRPDLHAEVGAVDLLTDPGQPWRQQQQQPDHRDRIAVALEHVVVAQELDRQCEEDKAKHEPVRLIAGQALVDPVDHHQPEGGQQGNQGEEVGIGVRQSQPQVDVGSDADREEVGAVDETEIAETGVLLGEPRGEPGAEQERDRDQGEELPVPDAAPQGTPWLRSMSSIKETASERERTSWPVTAARRLPGRDSVWIGLA